jgi:hypothetical protein
MTPNDTIVEESAKPSLNVDMDCVRNVEKGAFSSLATRPKIIKQTEKHLKTDHIREEN